MMTAMQTLGGLKSGNDLEKIYAFYQKYFFDNAQEYFPENAYNADAKYCYENGKLAYNAGNTPMIPILSHRVLAIIIWQNRGG